MFVESLDRTKDVVGARGFEPPTPRSRTECSTRLSHAPTADSSYSKCGPGRRISADGDAGRQIFDDAQHRVIGQIGLQRRNRGVAVHDRLVVGARIAFPRVLRLFNPEVRLLSRIEAL